MQYNDEYQAYVERFTKAVEKYNSSLESELLPLVDIGGILCHHMTIKSFQYLTVAENNILKGEAPKAEDLVQFFWLLSPDYKEREYPPKSFYKLVVNLDYIKTCNAVFNYLQTIYDKLEVFAPKAEENGPTKSFSNFMYSIIDFLASEYGWDESTCINTPIARAINYIITARVRNGESKYLQHPAEKVQGEFLAKINKLNAEKKDA